MSRLTREEMDRIIDELASISNDDFRKRQARYTPKRACGAATRCHQATHWRAVLQKHPALLRWRHATPLNTISFLGISYLVIVGRWHRVDRCGSHRKVSLA